MTMTNPETPHSIEAERSVLGAVLIDANAWPAVSHLTAGDFHRADHRAIYAALAELDEAGEPKDVVTVAERLDEAGTLDEAGGLAFLAELADNTPSAANARAYAGIVRDRAKRRRLSAALLDFARAARGPEPIGALVDRVTRALGEIEAAGAPAPSWPAVTAGDLLSEQDESLDWLVDGLLPAGGTSLMVGAPKSGKSSFARLLASKVASGATWHGHETKAGPVLYVTLDERRETVREHVRELVNGCDGERARARLRERLYLAFGPRPGHPAVALRAAVERIRPAPVLVVVDTLMKAFAFEDANDYGATGETMAAITALAHDTGAHVMLVHHARKDNTGHADLATAALGSTRIGADVDVLARVLVAKHDGREVRRVSFIGRDGVNAADVDVAYAASEGGASGGNPYA